MLVNWLDDIKWNLLTSLNLTFLVCCKHWMNLHIPLNFQQRLTFSNMSTIEWWSISDILYTLVIQNNHLYIQYTWYKKNCAINMTIPSITFKTYLSVWVPVLYKNALIAIRNSSLIFSWRLRKNPSASSMNRTRPLREVVAQSNTCSKRETFYKHINTAQ